ncbi:putative acetyltransferase [Vitis vinifera]|uniref:Putative acetyltransferase n=1 Tax=Vitis vinifera TaxID=29760 RepID=A0A438FLC0_VITVI|nr:putative acetyltransferase [Vitis vinifera]
MPQMQRGTYSTVISLHQTVKRYTHGARYKRHRCMHARQNLLTQAALYCSWLSTTLEELAHSDTLAYMWLLAACANWLKAVPAAVHVVGCDEIEPWRSQTVGFRSPNALLPLHSEGGLFTRPPFPIDALLALLKRALSSTLVHFQPLAGRLITDAHGYVYITCNDAGVDFIHANAGHIFIRDLLSPIHVPDSFKEFFAFDRTVSYDGHFKPIMAVQVTELADGVFIGCAVNHAVTDGTSFWNFFNTFADLSRGLKRISRAPCFERKSVLISQAVLMVPQGGPKVTFSCDAPLAERIFSFSREAILKLKSKVNNHKSSCIGEIDANEILGKQSNDPWKPDQKASGKSLSALLWRAVTQARKFHPSKTTTFRMAVNVRHRLEPKLDPLYFGNAIQSIPTYASAGDVLSRDLRWCAEQLNSNVKAHNDDMTHGHSGRAANKFDGKISAFPGREGGGSVDLEVVLSPETMAGLESDSEFMQYVTGCA